MDWLTRTVAAAAISAGALRITAEVLPAFGAASQTMQQYYLFTDFALLLGIGGVYAQRARILGPLGMLSFAIFLLGILLVRSSDVSFFGAHGYRLGAAIALLGIALLGAVMLTRRTLRIAPLFWFASLLSGAAGAMGLAPAALFLLSGLLFGLGSIAAGTETFRPRHA